MTTTYTVPDDSPDPDAAALTAGDGRTVRQRDGGVAAVPADHQRTGSGAVPEATRQQGGFLVGGVEAVSVDGPTRGRIRHP